MIYEGLFDTEETERRVLAVLFQLFGESAREALLQALDRLECVIQKKPDPGPPDTFEVVELPPTLRCAWCTSVASHVVAGTSCCLRCLPHAKQFARARQ